MSKRKWDEEGDNNSAGTEDLKPQVSQLKARVKQSTKALHGALKLARGFERQKLGRRQKNASDQPQTLLRLREEVIVLKQLDLEKTAKDQLLKQFRKVKRIREHAVFVQAYGPERHEKHVKAGAEANLIGRLFNSNPVKELMPDIMKIVHRVLGIERTVVVGPDPKSKRPIPSNGAPSRNGGTEGPHDPAHTNDNETVEGHDETHSIASKSDEGRFELFQDRLASSDDEENGSVISGHSELDSQEDIGETGSETESSDRSDNSIRREQKHSTRPGPTKQAAFLPSLSMGGYYSGSESGDEDTDAHGPALAKPRKNRRGQRARQQLAEQKYGQSAKHLAQKKQVQGTGATWDSKRGAIKQNDHSQIRSANTRDGGKPQQGVAKTYRDQAQRPERRTTKDDTGPVHPSWEAAKRRKMQSQTPAAFQGKKITFD